MTEKSADKSGSRNNSSWEKCISNEDFVIILQYTFFYRCNNCLHFMVLSAKQS